MMYGRTASSQSVRLIQKIEIIFYAKCKNIRQNNVNNFALNFILIIL